MVLVDHARLVAPALALARLVQALELARVLVQGLARAVVVPAVLAC